MVDYQKLRRQMVEAQLIPRGVHDELVLAAFKKVPRHRFVPGELLETAYGDYPLPIGEGQTISQPYMVALMTEALRLKEKERVLEVGTGSGYQAAVLAEIVEEVYTVERFGTLAEGAKKVLDELGYSDVKVKVGDGTLGWKEFSPYDGIVVTAGAPHAPQPLIDQLKEGGRIVIPIGGGFSQMLTLVEKTGGGKVSSQNICSCIFVPLIGEEGWKSRRKSR